MRNKIRDKGAEYLG